MSQTHPDYIGNIEPFPQAMPLVQQAGNDWHNQDGSPRFKPSNLVINARSVALPQGKRAASCGTVPLRGLRKGVRMIDIAVAWDAGLLRFDSLGMPATGHGDTSGVRRKPHFNDVKPQQSVEHSSQGVEKKRQRLIWINAAKVDSDRFLSV